MRILVVTQYFWPEKFRINDLVVGLKERGYEIEILTGKPNYGRSTFYDNYSFLGNSSEIWNDIKIHRIPLVPRGNAGNINLIINYLSFVFFGIIKAFLLRGKYDKIFVFAPSPITVCLPAIILKWRKRAPLYLWVQDLWPESVTATTNISNKGLVWVLTFITRWIYKNCNKILIQSRAFRSNIIAQGVEENKLIYYPNSVEALYKPVEAGKESLEQLPQGFRIIFAGNIGEAQDFDTLLKAACITRTYSKDIKWIIFGNGRKKRYVEEKISEYSLQETFLLLGERPMEQMPYFFSCADCLLISLKKEYIFSLTIPSKLQSYLACQKPILGSLNGEGARIIEDAQAGLVSPAEDPAHLANNIEEMFEMTEYQRARFGSNARTYFEQEFEREKLLSKLDNIFEIDL